MSMIKKLKKIWRSSKHIRPAFWAVYRYRPTALYMNARRVDYLNRIFPKIYTEAARKPVKKNLVLFVEIRFGYLSNSAQLLKERLEADGRFDVRVRCINSTSKGLLKGYASCRRLVAECARAKYIFTTDVSMVMGCLPMRSETVLVQLWHACGAFKRFGLSTEGAFWGDTAKFQKDHSGYANINYVTVSSPEVVWAYSEAMNLPEDLIHPVGVSRTDVFYDEDRSKKAYQTLYKKFPAAKGKKVILYAPTFRGHVRTASAPDEFRPELFAKAFKDEYVLIIKQHPFVKKLPPIKEELKGTFAYDATNEMEIEDLLMTADICITDYSSIIFEYSLLVRPMLFFAYDLKEYYDWRGFYYPYEEMTPGPVCKTNEEMIEYIRHIDENFDRAQVETFRDRFMSACDGHATDRIIADVVRDGKARK